MRLLVFPGLYLFINCGLEIVSMNLVFYFLLVHRKQFNCCSFSTFTDAPGAPRQWWFGGGTDLTPAYLFEEDVKHFHLV